MNPKNIRARIALSVNGAVIHVVRPVVDRAIMEREKIIPRQHVVRLENRKKTLETKDPPHIFWFKNYKKYTEIISRKLFINGLG